MERRTQGHQAQAGRGSEGKSAVVCCYCLCETRASNVVLPISFLRTSCFWWQIGTTNRSDSFHHCHILETCVILCDWFSIVILIQPDLYPGADPCLNEGLAGKTPFELSLEIKEAGLLLPYWQQVSFYCFYSRSEPWSQLNASCFLQCQLVCLLLFIYFSLFNLILLYGCVPLSLVPPSHSFMHLLIQFKSC